MKDITIQQLRIKLFGITFGVYIALLLAILLPIIAEFLFIVGFLFIIYNVAVIIYPNSLFKDYSPRYMICIVVNLLITFALIHYLSDQATVWLYTILGVSLIVTLGFSYWLNKDFKKKPQAIVIEDVPDIKTKSMMKEALSHGIKTGYLVFFLIPLILLLDFSHLPIVIFALFFILGRLYLMHHLMNHDIKLTLCNFFYIIIILLGHYGLVYINAVSYTLPEITFFVVLAYLPTLIFLRNLYIKLLYLK